MSKKNLSAVIAANLNWYRFDQNNSGGSFDTNYGRHVYIQATSADRANDIANDIGIYFDGCDNGEDCDCCGDRWYRVKDDKWDSKSDLSEFINDTYDDLCLVVPYNDIAYCHVPTVAGQNYNSGESRWGFSVREIQAFANTINIRKS